jgi:tripartite-type tricarboxylate transporter receptor subunit TctC
LSAKWKITVVTENKPGGAGAIGLLAYNKEMPDGYTIYYSDSSVMISYPALYNNQEIIKNIKPLTPVTQNYMMMIGSPKIKDFKELETVTRNNPIFGSWGIGSAGHMLGLEVSDFLNIKPTHVPYREYGQWYTDTSSGSLSFGFSTIASSTAMEQAGKIKYFAYAGPTRHPDFPNVPTLKESGHDVALEAWVGIAVPKATPSAVVARLEKSIRVAMSQPAIAASFVRIGADPAYMDGKTYTEFLKKEREVMERLIKESGIPRIQ